jgi:hypothetical protein
MTAQDIKALAPDDFVRLTNNLLSVIDAQNSQIENLKAIIALRNAETNKPSSEQLELLFDEAETLTGSLLEGGEPEEQVTVAGRQRVKGRRQDIGTLAADTPVVDVDHTKGSAERFEEGGVGYERDGERVIPCG